MKPEVHQSINDSPTTNRITLGLWIAITIGALMFLFVEMCGWLQLYAWGLI